MTKTRVNPNDILAPVYEAVGEGSPHIDAFTDQPGYQWITWAQDRSRIVPLIRAPLLDYWSGLDSHEKQQLRFTLQYLLNIDEFTPYEPWSQHPELKSKRGGVVDKYFMSYQDTIQPYDGYELCLWMWEILFPDEDWHADVKDWVVTDDATLYAKLDLRKHPSPGSAPADHAPHQKHGMLARWLRCFRFLRCS